MKKTEHEGQKFIAVFIEHHSQEKKVFTNPANEIKKFKQARYHSGCAPNLWASLHFVHHWLI